MKNTVFFIWLLAFTIGCNKDKIGPSIMLSENSFCLGPGSDIGLTVEINDPDLEEVNMTAPDLDFVTKVSGESFRNSGGVIDFIFSVDLETPPGNYIMGIEAVDMNENVSTQVIQIKII